MNALPSGAPALQAMLAIVSPSESVVARWTLEDREIRLLRQQDKLSFSVCADGVEIKRGDVPLNLYDINYALNLVGLFHKVIEQNLNRVAVTSSAFLPVLCIDPLVKKQSHTPAPHLKVALFGEVNQVTGNVFYGRFGVYNTLDRSVQSVVMDDQDETTKQFLVDAPRCNRPHADEQSPNHYAMTRYAKRFRPVVVYDSYEQIQSIALKRVSQINRNVVIDDHKWGVTLVCANTNTGLCGVGFNTGHAMIACEGVKQNFYGYRRQFLTYAHITCIGIPDPNCCPDQARVELLEEEIPRSSGYIYGPTWSSSKGLVESMLQNMQEDARNQRYVKFGKVINHYAYPESFGLNDDDVERLPILVQWASFIRGFPHDRRRTAPTVNCLLWCIQQLNQVGISLDSGLFKTPKAFVQSLDPHYPTDEITRSFRAREEDKRWFLILPWSWHESARIAAENFRRRLVGDMPPETVMDYEMRRGFGDA